MGFFGNIGRSIKRFVGDIARAGREKGIGGVAKALGGKILGGLKQVSQIPIIKDTPIGRGAQAITSVADITKTLSKGANLRDIPELIKQGRNIKEAVS